jgi:hypothetical protein
MIDEVAAQYVKVLKHFGIKKNGNNTWELHDKELNEVWIKK